MTSSLPPCDYRVPLNGATVYCRHTQVISNTGVVPTAACRNCSARDVPCIELRPAEPPDHMPPPGRMAWNAARAVASFIADGARTVSAKEYEARLDVCEACDRRRGNRCLECGCRLTLKARGRTFECPLNRWPGVGGADESTVHPSAAPPVNKTAE